MIFTVATDQMASASFWRLIAVNKLFALLHDSTGFKMQKSTEAISSSGLPSNQNRQHVFWEKGPKHCTESMNLSDYLFLKKIASFCGNIYFTKAKFINISKREVHNGLQAEVLDKL